jgi:hypothetical protein
VTNRSTLAATGIAVVFGAAACSSSSAGSSAPQRVSVAGDLLRSAGDLCAQVIDEPDGFSAFCNTAAGDSILLEVFRSARDRADFVRGSVHAPDLHCWGQDPAAVEYWFGTAHTQTDTALLARRLHGRLGLPPG